MNKNPDEYADDELPFAKVPYIATFEALLRRWAERDQRYAGTAPGQLLASPSLTPSEVEAARVGRQAEAMFVEKDQRAAAYGAARTWVPPVPVVR